MVLDTAKRDVALLGLSIRAGTDRSARESARYAGEAPHRQGPPPTHLRSGGRPREADGSVRCASAAVWAALSTTPKVVLVRRHSTASEGRCFGPGERAPRVVDVHPEWRRPLAAPARRAST